MDYKLKRILTDRDGRPFQQYFDEEQKEFKIQPMIATEKTLKRLVSAVSAASEEPPHLKNVKVINDSPVTYVHWFHDGLFYGSYSRSIYTSPDGENWTELTNLEGAESPIAFVVVSDTNRIIAACQGGQVFVSDENGEFSSTPAFTSGSFDVRFGHFKYRNIIGLNTYESHGFDDGQKHEAFLSTDNGETFKKVFDISTLDTLPPLDDDRYHLHDMEYDPYNGRLYLWTGDFMNRTLNYSDDWGDTWHTALPRGEAGNSTQVIATKDGIALGSDTNPGGIAFIELDRSKGTEEKPSIEKYDRAFWSFSDYQDRYVALRRWVERDKGIYLVPFAAEYDDNNSGIIAFSRDGYNWYEIYKSTSKGHWSGFYTVTYGNGLIVATLRDPDEGFKIFIAEADL